MALRALSGLATLNSKRCLPCLGQPQTVNSVNPRPAGITESQKVNGVYFSSEPHDQGRGAMLLFMKRYTILTQTEFSFGGSLPEAPSDENTVQTLAEVRTWLHKWLRESGNDYTRADGYGQPSAWVYLTESYDGISYGDYPEAVFERGPRGGIIRVSI